MAPCTVFFRPRPWVLKSYGTEWIPLAHSFRPYQVSHEEIPAAASDERQFDCSATLESHLFEFYQTIRPLLAVPSFDSTSSCTLYAEYHASPKKRKNTRRRINAFQRRTMKDLVAYFRALPPEIAQLVDVVPQLDATALAVDLTGAHIFAMRSELIELKAWASILTEILMYQFKWTNFVEELENCHLPDHQCPGPVPLAKVVIPAQPSQTDNPAETRGSTTAYRLDKTTPGDLTFTFNSAVHPNGLVHRRSQRSSFATEL
ncbi:hypothetical protein DFH06DRAFT_1347362 [Mycena polygramma]|nr:hypothetical protein DFH06DRAFT_1347362 [Mycena polygramma]